MNETARRRLALVLGVTLLAAVFVVPYRFPPASALLSASALAGFNNALAYNLYVPILGLLGVLLAPLVRKPPTFTAAVPHRPLFGVPPVAALLVIAAHVALFAALYLQKHAFVFAEALYFEDAAYRVIAGQLPFVDFNFFYGPLLVFPAAILGRVLGVMLGYAIVYVAAYAVGLYLLYVAIAWLVEDRREAARWFALLSIGLFNPITGLNYTFGRFTLPIVCLIATWRCSVAFTVRRWILAVVLVAMAILCSPDIAAVTVAGTALQILLRGTQAARRGPLGVLAPAAAIPLAGLSVAMVPLLVLDGTMGPVIAYVKPIATFSGGGWATPIDPSIPMLAVLGITMLAVSVLAAAWRSPDGAGTRPLIASFAVTLVLMQRAIFGKADVLHIAYSGLPALLVAVAWAASQGSRRLNDALAALLIVGLALPLQFYHAMLFAPSLAARFAAADTVRTVAPARTASKEEIQASLANAVNRFGDDCVYYMHKLEYYRLPLYLERRLKPFLFHPSLTSAFTREDIDGVIHELKRDGAVVLARKADLVLDAPPRPLPLHWSYFVTSAPLPGSEVFNLTLEFQRRLEKPLVEFLTTAYDTDFEDGEIVGLRLRKSAVASWHALQ